jgi:hypothetical protein
MRTRAQNYDDGTISYYYLLAYFSEAHLYVNQNPESNQLVTGLGFPGLGGYQVSTKKTRDFNLTDLCSNGIVPMFVWLRPGVNLEEYK